MRLIANTQLTGIYGTVVAGQEFDCHDATALELLAAGVVRRAGPPAVRYETKVIAPEAPEVSAREPFPDMPLPDPQPETVAPESDSVLPGTDVREEGTADSRGRRGHPRSGAERSPNPADSS